MTESTERQYALRQQAVALGWQHDRVVVIDTDLGQSGAATDREGLFADLAQAIASLGGNVVGARIYTSSRGEALDAFYVQDVSGAPFGAQHPRLLARLVEAMEAAALGRPAAVEAKKPDLGRAAAKCQIYRRPYM